MYNFTCCYFFRYFLDKVLFLVLFNVLILDFLYFDWFTYMCLKLIIKHPSCHWKWSEHSIQRMTIIFNRVLILRRLMKIKWLKIVLFPKLWIKYHSLRKVQHYKDLEDQIVKRNLNSIIQGVEILPILLYLLTYFRVLNTG